jgi:hypothetical protein
MSLARVLHLLWKILDGKDFEELARRYNPWSKRAKRDKGQKKPILLGGGFENEGRCCL